MEEFNERYGFYPKYPVADAGYGSYNNYIYCQDHDMEKYMKFSMYKKTFKIKEDDFVQGGTKRLQSKDFMSS